MFPMLSLLAKGARAGALALALSAVFSAAAQADDAPSLRASIGGAPAETTYILGTGDKIHVTVFGEDDLGGDFEVDSNGFVRLPLIGPVRATGLSSHALEDRISTALEEGYLKEPRVNVEIVNYRPFYIIGEVNKPGQYPYVNEMTVINAVALAGGYTEKANDSWIYVRRLGEAAEEKLPADPTTRIEPGDVVRVAPTLFWSGMNIIAPVSQVVASGWFLSQL
jgi:protein involved in polysaccharide export with SLBB domain